MKNIVKAMACAVMVGLMVWGVWSWHDVVSSNAPTSNKELSKYNFFALLTKSEEVESERKECAYIESTTDASVLFCTTDGELWELRVAEPADWNISEDYVITFDTMETEEKEDDRIVAVSVLQELKSHG